MTIIKPDMSIAEVLRQFPETKDLFAVNGLNFSGGQEALLKTLTLSSFMQMRELNPEIFLSLLEKHAEAAEVPLLYSEDAPEQKPDFLGYVICPVKLVFKEAFEQAMRKHVDNGGERLTCFVPMGCGGDDPYEDIWKTDNIDDLPDVICSMGFGSFYRDHFRKNFLDKGLFSTPQMKPIPEPFASAGFEDPKGIYTVYAVHTYVMLVDHKKLKGLPVPRNWCDLLDPIYKDNIIVGGGEDHITEVLLFHIWKEYGEDGFKKLMPNIKDAWHASQMAKAAGSSMASGAAIYVLPWFFAQTCPNVGTTADIIWPDEGALASPMYMLCKKGSEEKMKPVIDFITGSEMSKIMTDACTPSLYPKAENNLPEGAKIKWIGWDFIHSRDIKVFSDEINNQFLEMLNKNKTAGGRFRIKITV